MAVFTLLVLLQRLRLGALLCNHYVFCVAIPEAVSAFAGAVWAWFEAQDAEAASIQKIHSETFSIFVKKRLFSSCFDCFEKTISCFYYVDLGATEMRKHTAILMLRFLCFFAGKRYASIPLQHATSVSARCLPFGLHPRPWAFQENESRSCSTRLCLWLRRLHQRITVPRIA